jgi:molecular chaperone DnaJ
MTTQRDLYDVLGIERGASDEEVKRAFRQRAMEYHPDRNDAEDAETRFKEVNAAYEVLSDAEKRSLYDRLGMAGVNGNGQGFSGHENFGGFGDIFDSFFRGTASRRATAQRGADIQMSLTLDFEEAVFGSEQKLNYQRTQSCPDCEATGQKNGGARGECPDCQGSGELRRVQQSLFGQFVNVATCSTCRGIGSVVTDPCETCRGRGLKRSKVRRTIKVPAGVDIGAQIRVAGEGDAGVRGGPAGNLYVEISVRPDERFERIDDDLVFDLPLNMAQAALGTTAQIPTIDGEPVELKVRPGTQHGTVLSLGGYGVPHVRGNGRGDLLVRTFVVTPTKLSAEQQELMQQLANSLGTPEVPRGGDSLFERLRGAFSG